MKTTTTTKIIAAAAALLITLGTVRHLTQKEAQTAPANADDQTTGLLSSAERVRSTSEALETLSPKTRRAVQPSREAKPSAAYDETALKAAREKVEKFWQRMGQLALVGDPLK